METIRYMKGVNMYGNTVDNKVIVDLFCGQ